MKTIESWIGKYVRSNDEYNYWTAKRKGKPKRKRHLQRTQQNVGPNCLPYCT
jgi:hypothetical protein